MARLLPLQIQIYFSLIFLLPTFFFSTSLSTVKHHRCLSDQKSTLMQMKHDILCNSSNFDQYNYAFKIKQWNSGRDCCAWEGITCDTAGHVIGLDLNSEGLSGNSGAILYHHLPQLHFLSTLYLQGNYLSSMPLNFLSNFSHLESLSLYDCELQGNFPESVFLLPKLRNIDLTYNEFLTGQLPEFSFNSSLESLDLSTTSFYGRIPNSISNLKLLKSLHLSSNNFSGMIPCSLSNLSQIVELDLGNNRFRGSIPPFHSHSVPKLAVLTLANNQLGGFIHSSLFTLPSLQSLAMGGNQFEGQLEEFTNASLSVLEGLSLAQNNLTGPIPRGILELSRLISLVLSNSGLSFRYHNNSFPFPQLEFLALSNCDLTEFPNILKNTVRLTYLDLSNNHIHGHVPNWIWKSTLEELYLSNNAIDFLDSNASMPRSLISRNHSSPYLRILECRSCKITKFPDFLKFQSELHILDFSHNEIGGKVPNWLWRLGHLNMSYNILDAFDQTHPNISSASISVLDLQSNKLQGSFPVSICNSSSLRFLDASQNHLTGLIPECIGKLNDLYALNVNRNDFQGMPPNFTLMNSLRSLKIKGNQLEGGLPRSLVRCAKLTVLDLGDNKIYDTFPFWLEKLPLLRVLILRGNRFYGTIGDHKVKFVLPSLRVVDLSSNNFTGELSKEFFQSLKAMVKVNETKYPPTYIGEDYEDHYTESVEIIEKGAEMVLPKILTSFTSLDLSNNGLQGEIPKEIGDLRSLRAINLSGNGFTDKIPSSLCNLAELESIDLSRNMLSGEIPAQLSDLTFLSMMNLSYNHLEGRIPQGHQFDTFSNNSYLGNPNLCGVPLSKSCEVVGETPSEEKIENSEKETMSEWKIVLMGYGCGVVIGFSIGYMLWPKMESLSLMMKFRDRVQRRKQVRQSKHGRELQQGRR